MKKYRKISLDTDKNSLREFNQEISQLINSQPPQAKKLFEQLIDYYQKIILCMPNNVYWVDNDTLAVGCNQNVLDIFNFTCLRDFEGGAFEKIAQISNWEQEECERFKRDTQEVIRTKKAKINVEEPMVLDQDGNSLYFLTSRMPLFNCKGNVLGVVSISTDITQQKLTQKYLYKANQAKSDFLANISHDLRTPLASLIGLTEHLTDKVTDPDLQIVVYDTLNCAEQLLTLIDEMVEISRMESGQSQNSDSTFNLAEIIHSISQLVKPMVLQKSLQLDCQLDTNLPKYVSGKVPLLRRILLNLTSNAIKFTSYGKITIRANLLNRINDLVQIEIQVQDSGIGIDPTLHEKIFGQFERAEAAYKNHYEGRGLGLYIVKKFITAMGGTISVDSAINQGSTFTIQLPLKIVNVSETKTISSVPIAFKSIQPPIFNRILLVEDTLIAQKAAVILLQSYHFQVDCAQSGKAAIEKIKSNDYDLIFLDLGLPDMSGLEVAQKIRAIEVDLTKIQVPIIALTAHISEEAANKCLSAEIQQVICKPLTKNKMDAILQAWGIESPTNTSTS